MECSRQEHWQGLPFPSPGDLPDTGIEPGSPALQADSSLSQRPGKPNVKLRIVLIRGSRSQGVGLIRGKGSLVRREGGGRRGALGQDEGAESGRLGVVGEEPWGVLLPGSEEGGERNGRRWGWVGGRGVRRRQRASRTRTSRASSTHDSSELKARGSEGDIEAEG